MASLLTREQSAAVASRAHALAIHAGAGTGKTLTLAHRVARLAAEQGAHRLLVVTFTREATASLQRKLSFLLGRGHLARVITFHQWAARELPPEDRRFFEEAHARRLLDGLLARRRHDALARALGGKEAAPRLASLFGFVKNRECTLAAALAGPFASLAPFADELSDVQDAYEEAKGDRLDFDDVPILFRDRLERSPTFRKDVAARLAHVFVDEYQDVNAAQAGAVRILTTPRGAPGVTVVGDPRQAIYGFRGASPDHLLRFPDAYGRRAKVVALTTNFRAARPLVEAANVVEPSAHPMRPSRAAPRRGLLRVAACADAGHEARVAADHVEALLRDATDPGEIAILCRARRLGAAFALELEERRRDPSRAGSRLDEVVVRTIHAAKGLEWDHVVLLGAREGGLPSDHALLAPDAVRAELLAEERRLLYVALTRARRSFLATWPAGGRHGASRFLAPLVGREALA